MMNFAFYVVEKWKQQCGCYQAFLQSNKGIVMHGSNAISFLTPVDFFKPDSPSDR